MRKQFILLLLICLMVLVVGCVRRTTDTDPIEIEEFEFDVVEPSNLPTEELNQWYNDHHKEALITSFDHEDFTYILLSVGERPTGGYELNINSVIGTKEAITINGELVTPAKEEMVIQVITYPHQLIRIKRDERPIVIGELKEVVREIENLDGSADIKEERTFEGIYVGQIDNNSIEVKVDGEPMTFRLSIDFTESFEANPPKDNSKIVFSAFENALGQWIITSIEN